MLAFYLNNKSFAVDEDNSVKLTWRNPACNFDSFPGDVGLGINIPANDINRTILGNPEDFERYAKENTREFEGFEIHFSGVLLMAGTLIIKTADNESYNCWLRSNTGNIGEEHREKYIYDSISFKQQKVFQNKSDYDPDVDEYACPGVYNPDFFKEKGQKVPVIKMVENPSYGKLIIEFKWSHILKIDDREYIPETVESEDLTEAFLRYSGWQVNAKNEDGTIKAPKTSSDADAESVKNDLDVSVVSPMLFLNYAIKTLFKDAKFGIKENFIADDPDLKRLVIYHNFDINEIATTADRSFYKDFWDETYEGIYEDHTPRARSVGNRINLVGRQVNTFYYKELFPPIKLKEFILSVQNLLNVFFHFQPNRRIVNIIDRESVFTSASIDISKYLDGNWQLEDKKDSSLKFVYEHDGDDLIFNEQWADLTDYRLNEKEPVDTWDELEQIDNPEMDEIRFVRETNTYVQYKLWLLENTDEETGENTQEKYIGWRHLSIGFQHAFYNHGKDETEEIKTEFSTLVGEESAETRQMGNMRSEQFEYSSFTPRLLFYNGNNTGAYQTSNLSLDFEQETTGLLEKRWRYWSRFWATRQPVSCKAHFPLGVLDHVLNNIYRKFKSREGEFIIEEITTEFGTNQIGATEIKGYKMNYSPRVYSLEDAWDVNDVIWVDETIDMTGAERFFPLVID
ncbi:hypothetical protein SAMN05444280_108119 [Tangfeifania diversioriginum]|uniref:Uncharacterized protein n=1 Tax=Tangfeifania diversioriginum TaxID=1168035 RepID=A0A1M6FCS1_9BACT|nr:hypothetical protein [Tangfeifania diversioriginum]SHI95453.1 hypothetical protein SAMN05444280_108119 [Tangfeifania diversioriginum]